MNEEKFSVVVFDPEGYHRTAATDLNAEMAVQLAKELVDLAATPLGRDTDRVIITDDDDYTVFCWERRFGLVFPPLARAGE